MNATLSEVLTAAVAVLGIWLCNKVDKKSSNLIQ